MKDTLTWRPALPDRRPPWLIVAASTALAAAVIAIAVVLATSTNSKPAVTQKPAHTGNRTAAACAPDDTLPIGPEGDGVPACLVHDTAIATSPSNSRPGPTASPSNSLHSRLAAASRSTPASF